MDLIKGKDAEINIQIHWNLIIQLEGPKCYFYSDFRTLKMNTIQVCPLDQQKDLCLKDRVSLYVVNYSFIFLSKKDGNAFEIHSYVVRVYT